jgi:pantoate--beta-alanine ligase
MKRVSIYGTGCVGAILASRIAPVVEVVQVLTRTKTQADNINRDGLVVISGGKQNIITNVKAYTRIDDMAGAGLGFVAVKQPEVEMILDSVNDQTVVSLQNGISYLEKAGLIQGLCYFGAARDGDCFYENGVGEILLESAVDTRIMAAINARGPETYQRERNTKAIINSIINPLTAVLGIQNGLLLQLPGLDKTMKVLLGEANQALDMKVSYAQVKRVIKSTAGNTSSMLLYINMGKTTELDWITKPMLNGGKSVGHGILYNLVKAKEELGKSEKKAGVCHGDEKELLVLRDPKVINQKFRGLRGMGKTLGFVPTMGCLHVGHLSLAEASVRENDITAVSIYVNPTQFAEGEDLDTYPRQLEKDIALCKEVGVDYVLVFDDLYDSGHCTWVSNQLSSREEESRPHFFRGVLTVCTKLWNIVEPDRVYLGQKDGVQAMHLRNMTRDLHFQTEVRVCNTLREDNGLAMSSRNEYLSDAEREQAGVIYQALCEAVEMVNSGVMDSQEVIENTRIQARRLAQLQKGV